MLHELNKEVKCCCKDTVFYSVSQMKQRFIYKKIIYLKAENYDTLVKIKNRTEVYARESRYYKNVTVMFDFNPVNGF